MPNKIEFTLKYLKSANKIKTRMLCNECEQYFLKYLAPKVLEVECPKCGSFDTEPDEA